MPDPVIRPGALALRRPGSRAAARRQTDRNLFDQSEVALEVTCGQPTGPRSGSAGGAVAWTLTNRTDGRAHRARTTSGSRRSSPTMTVADERGTVAVRAFVIVCDTLRPRPAGCQASSCRRRAPGVLELGRVRLRATRPGTGSTVAVSWSRRRGTGRRRRQHRGARSIGPDDRHRKPRRRARHERRGRQVGAPSAATPITSPKPSTGSRR